MFLTFRQMSQFSLNFGYSNSNPMIIISNKNPSLRSIEWFCKKNAINYKWVKKALLEETTVH